jgi:perosamine synthetase
MTDLSPIQISFPYFDSEEQKAVADVLATGWVTQGPKVVEFENKFNALHRVRNSVAVTSCTTGLHLPLAAWGIGPGDEVLVPSFTWITSAHAVVYCGATPVLVDVDRSTYNIDIKDVAGKVTERTKAIIPVHLFGLCVDMDELKAVLPPHVRILEDAACAVGASYKGRFAGTLGDAGAFSFHPRKTVTTGEGGIVTTNDDAFAEELRILRNHGARISDTIKREGPKPHTMPDFDMLGYNYRMTDIQAALGCAQLDRLEWLIQGRRKLAARYDELLGNIEWLRLPKVGADFGHGWQAYVAYMDPKTAPLPRNEFMERLQSEHKINTRPGTHAVHMQDYYRQRFGYHDDQFAGARDCANNTIALPLHNRMSPGDLERVVDAIRKVAA